MIVTDDLRALLATAETDGTMARFPQPLDRNTYTRLDKVLVGAGGRWSRRDNAHVFPTTAADVLEQMILTGMITTARDMGYFPTPPAVIDRLIAAAGVGPGMLVLEPSAGTGELVAAIAATGATVDAIELDAQRFVVMLKRGVARRWANRDFLEIAPDSMPAYDRIVMNPPFARQADITHVFHAVMFLRPGGKLVSVMSDGLTFRSGKAAALRELVTRAGGTIEELPPESFASSGTAVRTVMVVIPT